MTYPLILYYDLLSTQVYPNLAEKTAMKIGGENRADWLQSRHWERFADNVELKRRYVLDRVRNMVSKIVTEAETLSENFEGTREGLKTIGKIKKLVQKHGLGGLGATA